MTHPTKIEDLWALYWREPGPMTLHALPLCAVLRKNSKNVVSGQRESMVIVGVHGNLEEALEYRRYLNSLRKEASHEDGSVDQVSGVRVQVQSQETPGTVPALRGAQ
jgi:hypothetical protein